jgi:hypothetical protein
MMTKSKIERLRLQYRPERITVLFVGEAPPASDTFFYRGNSGLTNYMRDALGGPKGDIEFLNWFKARGWYLGRPLMICGTAESNAGKRARVWRPE